MLAKASFGGLPLKAPPAAGAPRFSVGEAFGVGCFVFWWWSSTVRAAINSGGVKPPRGADLGGEGVLEKGRSEGDIALGDEPRFTSDEGNAGGGVDGASLGLDKRVSAMLSTSFQSFSDRGELPPPTGSDIGRERSPGDPGVADATASGEVPRKDPPADWGRDDEEPPSVACLEDARGLAG